jgi:hypothetical protein
MEVNLQAYKELIRPVLEYASTASDPHQSYLQEKLEKVQKSASRFITSNYNYEPGSITTILNQTKLEPLKERRKQNRLILFCNGIHHLVDIPTDDLQRPLRTTKNMQSTLSQTSSQDRYTEIQLPPENSQKFGTFYRKTSSTRFNLRRNQLNQSLI